MLSHIGKHGILNVKVDAIAVTRLISRNMFPCTEWHTVSFVLFAIYNNMT